MEVFPDLGGVLVSLNSPPSWSYSESDIYLDPESPDSLSWALDLTAHVSDADEVEMGDSVDISYTSWPAPASFLIAESAYKWSVALGSLDALIDWGLANNN